MIKRIKLFANQNEKAKEVQKKVEKALLEHGFILSEDAYDLAIAIGGDGSFLRMVKKNHFDSDVYYIGINAGTLGFAQEVSVDHIDDFMRDLENGAYKVEEIGIQETTIQSKEGESHFYTLNEICIRDYELNTTKLQIRVNKEVLERFVGDGLLIATSFGSTAYNLSFGGSIIYNSLHTLQITPIAPLNNRSYHTLFNSVVIPENMQITIIPEDGNKDLLLSIDGENKIYHDVDRIQTSVNKKRIKCLRRMDYDFSKKVNEKFLK